MFSGNQAEQAEIPQENNELHSQIHIKKKKKPSLRNS